MGCLEGCCKPWDRARLALSESGTVSVCVSLSPVLR